MSDHGDDLTTWQVDREVATDLPEQVRATAGVSAAEAKLDIVAPDGTVPGWWSPWLRKRRSVGLPVTLDAELDGTTVRMFTGRTVTASADADSDTIALSALDSIHRMVGKVDLAAFTATMGEVHPGMHGLWLIEHILRRYGWTPLPKSLPDLMFHASLAGSVTPSVGTLATLRFTDDQPPMFVTRDDMPMIALTGSDLSHIDADADGGDSDDEFWDLSAQWLFQGFVPFPDQMMFGMVIGDTVTPPYGETILSVGYEWSASDPGDKPFMRIRWSVSRNETYMRFEVSDSDGVATSTASQTIDLGTTWVGIEKDGDTLGFHIWQHGRYVNVDPLELDVSGFPDNLRDVNLVVHGSASLSNIQIGQGWWPDDPDDFPEHDPTAFDEIDEPLGILHGVPPLERADGIDILRDLAAAELGGFWFDEYDRPVFRNRASMRGVGSDPVSVTSAESLASFRWSETVEQTAAVVEAVSSRPTSEYEDDPPHDVWTADEIYRLDGGQTLELEVQLDHAVGMLETPLVGSATSGSRYRASRSPDGTGSVVLLGDFDNRQAVQTGPDTAVIRLTNTSPSALWFATADGEPSIVLAAKAIIDAGQQVTARRETTADTTNRLTLDANPWRQDSTATRDLVRFLWSEVATPRPMIQSVRVVPSADTLSGILGRVIVLEDPHVSGLNVRALVRKSAVSASAGETVQTLEVQPLRPTMADLDTAWDGQTMADMDAFWDGQTMADMDANPLLTPETT